MRHIGANDSGERPVAGLATALRLVYGNQTDAAVLVRLPGDLSGGSVIGAIVGDGHGLNMLAVVSNRGVHAERGTEIDGDVIFDYLTGHHQILRGIQLDISCAEHLVAAQIGSLHVREIIDYINIGQLVGRGPQIFEVLGRSQWGD